MIKRILSGNPTIRDLRVFLWIGLIVGCLILGYLELDMIQYVEYHKMEDPVAWMFVANLAGGLILCSTTWFWLAICGNKPGPTLRMVWRLMIKGEAPVLRR